MASGWTTGGIDWANIRDNRYEQTVLELYKATHERDFFIRKTAGFPNASQYNPPNPKIRLDSQLRFIFDALTNWLTLDLAPTQADGYIENQAVFIDEGLVPIGLDISNVADWNMFNRRNHLVNTNVFIDLISPQINLQVPHYDMASGGNLELELNTDLSFLRNYQVGQRATSPLNLKKIYDILRFLTKSRVYQVRKTGLEYQHYLVGTGTNLQYSSGGGIIVPQDSYNAWVADSPSNNNNSQYVYAGYSQETDYKSSGDSIYLITSNEAYFRMTDMTGHDGLTYTTTDFEFQTLFNQFTGGWDNNPMIPIVDGINIMGDIPEEANPPSGAYGVKAFSFPNTAMQTFPPILTDFSWSIFETLGKIMPYANLNKEGFLNYYTETP